MTLPDQSNVLNNRNTRLIPWAELVVYLSDMNYADLRRLNQWKSAFYKVTVLGPEAGPTPLPDGVEWKIYDRTITRSKIWNQQLLEAEKEWVLFIEDDEEMKFLDFPEEEDINEKIWPPTLITSEEAEKKNQFYQIRFIHNAGEPVFKGENLPDCTQYITAKGIELSNMPIQLQRKTNPFANIDTSVEFAIANYAPQTYLIEGYRFFKKGKYVQAAAQYRQLLKTKKLLSFDRLAAVNGLASCFAEQYKWSKAIHLTQQSLKAEPFQNIPYLIEYRIYQLQRQWEEAYNALNRYYETADLHTRANFDLTLSLEETLVNLADLSLKIGNRAKASEHLNEFFKLKNGNVEPSFLKKLLVLCIELKDREKSIFFFTRFFEDFYPNNLDEAKNAEINDFMSLFMNNDWYEFVYKVYSELHKENQEVDEYKRRLIVVSIKTNRLDQARQLATKVA